MAEDFVQGWTKPIRYRLKRDGAAFDATGLTPTIVAYDRNWNLLTLTGTVAWEDATTSLVRYTPASGDLVAANSLMSVRFALSDGSFFPKGLWETWTIRK